MVTISKTIGFGGGVEFGGLGIGAGYIIKNDLAEGEPSRSVPNTASVPPMSVPVIPMTIRMAAR